VRAGVLRSALEWLVMLITKMMLLLFTSGLPVDFLRLERLSTLWVEGNPIEFPPPPIADTGFKNLFAWLRQSKEACAERTPVVEGQSAVRPGLERASSGSDTFSRVCSSQRLSRAESSLLAARCCFCCVLLYGGHIFERNGSCNLHVAGRTT